jgi:hypothetical protein
MVQLTCKCGALYDVKTVSSPMGDTGVAICQVCKREMDRWNAATIHETYTLLDRRADQK